MSNSRAVERGQKPCESTDEESHAVIAEAPFPTWPARSTGSGGAIGIKKSRTRNSRNYPMRPKSKLVISPYGKKGREVIAELILGDEVSHNLYPETKDNVRQSVTILDESCV